MKWLALTLLLSGCTLTDSTGTRHSFVIGFGILSVQQTNSVLVYKSQILGLGAGDLPGMAFTAGYSSSIGVCATSNTLVEVSQKPFAPIRVTQP